MITEEEREMFLNWSEDPKKHVLSIYLDIDSSWEKLPGRKFEVEFNAAIQSLEPKIESGFLEEFKKDAARARQLISAYQPNGQGLILFVDDSENFIWSKEVKFHLPNQIHWLAKPYVLPLLEMFDEYERYGVILAEKGKARIFTYVLGEIEAEQDILPANEVRSKKTANMDHLRSQMNFQHTAEMHVTWHLKHVCKEIEKIAHRCQFNRLILGGSKEAVDELSGQLSEELQHKISGRLAISVEAEEKELNTALIEMVTRIEREKEISIVEKIMNSDFPEGRVLGLEGIVIYVDKGLVHQLIYSEHFKPEGGKCSGCGYLYANQRFVCGRCESKINPIPNFLEEIARAVVQKGGQLEEVKSDAANKLDEAGGVAAVLKEKR